MRRFLLTLLGALLMLGCFKSEEQLPEIEESPCEWPDAESNSLFYVDAAGDQRLWAGEDSSTHFLANNFSLDPCKLHYGIGRELFPALIETKFQALSDVITRYPDHERCIVVKSSVDTKIFPYSVLQPHELVNIQVGSQSLMVVYCFLADLAAVYKRNYCGRNLTFAVSGYTYYDEDIKDGLESFILWDRDTESLWWPITNRAISGPYRGVDMEKHESQNWDILTWSEVVEQYPYGKVMRSGQSFDPPETWTLVGEAGCGG